MERSELDKRYKNYDDDLTIFDVEVTQKDTSGPWSTTASNEDLIHIKSKGSEGYSIDDIMDWAIMVEGFKSSYMVDRKIGRIYETRSGEWALEFKTTVWQN